MEPISHPNLWFLPWYKGQNFDIYPTGPGLTYDLSGFCPQAPFLELNRGLIPQNDTKTGHCCESEI